MDDWRKIKISGNFYTRTSKTSWSYVPIVISGNLAFVSGQIPIYEGKIKFKGSVPNQQSLESAQEAAKLCIINALAQLKNQLQDLNKIKKIVKITGYVQSDKEFWDQPKVINAASDLLFEIFEERGQHSRVAIGTSNLPLNSTVEIDMIAEISN